MGTVEKTAGLVSDAAEVEAIRTVAEMTLFIAAAIPLVVGFIAGHSFGWNAACALYRDRAIDRANQQYEQDWK